MQKYYYIIKKIPMVVRIATYNLPAGMAFVRRLRTVCFMSISLQ